MGPLPRGRWDEERFFHPDRAHPGTAHVREGGFLESIDSFDAEFFGYSPREAARMDPQQRLFLEVAWEALEDAGVVVGDLAGSTAGVFVGVAAHDYEILQFRDPDAIDAHTMTGVGPCIVANRLSHALDLRGPSIAVDTACSSGLVAVHLACASLQRGECTLAVAGAASLICAPEPFVGFSRASMLSPDGRCFAFDARANGYARGEGVGAVVLKPLDRALADADNIYAVIRGSATGNDGRTVGISAPDAAAQAALLRAAYARAGVPPERVQYVEAHGTGTVAGDPAECHALGQVLGRGTRRREALLVGSVKTGIGHLEAASGVAGLVKVALALRHRTIPASLHFEEPNPAIPFDELGIRVLARTEPWPVPDEGPLLAGVNSFGFGGTGAHLVLEGPPAAPSWTAPDDGPFVLPLSGRSAGARRDLARRYLAGLGDVDEAGARHLAAAAAVRRDHHPWRAAVVAHDVPELRLALEALVAGEPHAGLVTGGHPRAERPRVAFAFSGNGPQWWAMGRQLLAADPVFRQTLESVDARFRQLAGVSVLDELARDEERSRMDRTEVAQPALFAVQMGIVAVLRSWGIRPDAVVGHSVGEIAAAHVAGILDLEDALLVLWRRSAAQARTRGTGRMAALGVEPERALALLAPFGDRLALAARNAPAAVTVAGDSDALRALAWEASELELDWRDLDLAYAFHSPHMDPVRDEVLEGLADLAPFAATIPFFSTVAGARLEGRELVAEHWWRNIREPVRFDEAARALGQHGCEVVVEIGPHPVLLGYLRACLPAARTLPTLRRGQPEQLALRACLAGLYAAGAPVGWPAVLRQEGPLPHRHFPAYPWQGERHWHQPEPRGAGAAGPLLHPLLGRRVDGPSPAWERSLDRHRAPWVADHVVRGSVVVPMTAYLEIALAAAGQLLPERPCALSGVQIRRPLVLAEGPGPTVRCTVDSADHRFRIDARPAEGGEWRDHVLGRIASLPVDAESRLDLSAVRCLCTEYRTQAEHLWSARRVGLSFGPAFQGLEGLWLGEGELLAEIVVPEGLSMTGYRFHPAVLDACLQAVVGFVDAESAATGAAWMPVRVARLRFLASPGQRMLCHQRLRRRERRSVTVDVVVADPDRDGAVLATFEGLRFQAVPAGTREAARRLLHGLEWVEAPLAPPPASDHLPDPATVAAALQPTAAALARRLDRRRLLGEVLPRLDEVCRAWTWAALQDLGQSLVPGERLSVEALVEQGRVAPAHRAWLRRLLDDLARAGHLAREAGDWVVATAAPPPGAPGLWRELAHRRPDLVAELQLVARCGRALPAVLRGEESAVNVLFSDDSALGHFYESAPMARVYGELLRAAVAQMVAALPPTAVLRVLEVGAGTGGTTTWLLPELPPTRTEFVFSDVSEAFLARAEQRFRDRGFVGTQLFDAARPPSEQGLASGSFDLVVAAHVLHTTADLRLTLSHLRELLAPGGVLAVLEATRPPPALDFIFGSLPGWWSFTDRDLRPEHPLLDRAAWEALLADSGFDAVAAVSELPEGGPGTILLARRSRGEAPGTAAPRAARWLLVEPDAALGEQVTRALAAAGDAAWRVSAAEAPTALAAGGRFDGVLWLAAAAPPEALLDLAGAAEGGPMGLARLARALAEVTDPPPLWIITRGAQPGLGTAPSATSLAQACVVGLARVLGNEHPGLRPSLVDLGEEPDEQELRALVSELHAAAGEREVVLRGDRRAVARLARRPLEVARPPGDPARETWRLEAPPSRTFDDLAFRALPRRAPGQGEVEIAVSAAALNFHDVATAMGLLVDEALEERFYGSSLGMECAGQVVATGEGVSHLAPGQAVVALAAGTLAGTVVTPAALVAPLPPGLDAEAAAGLPTAYLTAWYALVERARLAPGETVLVHGAAGGVGLAAVQVARLRGARVFGTAGSPERRDWLCDVGVERVFDSRTLAFVDEVRAATGGEGVDVLLNAVAGEAIPAGLGLLRPFGRFLELGKRDLYDDSRIGLRPFAENVAFFGIDVDQLLARRPRETAELLARILQSVAEGRLHPLPHRVFDLREPARAFDHLRQSRQLGKVVLAAQGPPRAVLPPEPAPFRCRDDATWLVTGGLGGFGLATAAWLADRGARHLVLAGRRGLATDAARRAVGRLEALGVRVRAEAVDVADEPSVEALLARVAREGPPLRGVVHAAMVLEDAILLRLDEDSLARVLRPKVLGAWHLHRHAGDLDHFLLFSSFTSLIGNPGQAAYVSANAFLDALAWHRHALGLPALTVNWGAVADVGFVAANAEVRESLARRGLRPVPPEQGLDLLGALLVRDPVQVGIVDFDAARWTATVPRAAGALYAGLAPGDPRRAADDAAGGAGTDDLSPEGRRAAVAAELAAMVGQVLQRPAGRLDPDRSLTAMGLDSLMAVELQNRIADAFGVEVRVMQLMQGPSLRQLTELVLGAR